MVAMSGFTIQIWLLYLLGCASTYLKIVHCFLSTWGAVMLQKLILKNEKKTMPAWYKYISTSVFIVVFSFHVQFIE